MNVPAVSVSTSIEAAESMRLVAQCLQADIFIFLCRKGAEGATCEEVEESLHMKHQTASARLRELERMNMVFRRGDRRANHTGRSGLVYRSFQQRTVEDV